MRTSGRRSGEDFLAGVSHVGEIRAHFASDGSAEYSLRALGIYAACFSRYPVTFVSAKRFTSMCSGMVLASFGTKGPTLSR